MKKRKRNALRICTSCGQEIPAGARFCIRCGCEAPAEAEISAEEEKGLLSRLKRSDRIVLIVAVAAVLVIAVCAAGIPWYLRMKAEVTGITITQDAVKTEYFIGDTLDTEGMRVEAQHRIGSNTDVTEECSCTPLMLTTLGEQLVTVNYRGYAVRYLVTVKYPDPVGLTVESAPLKLEYSVGNAPDMSGLVLSAELENGKYTRVVTGYTVSPEVFTEEGEQDVTVEWQGLTVTIPVKVGPVSEEGIRMAEKPFRMRYYLGEKPDPEGMKIELVMSDGTVKDVTNACRLSPEVFTEEGFGFVTVTFGEHEGMYPVFVSGDITVSGEKSGWTFEKLVVNDDENDAENSKDAVSRADPWYYHYKISAPDGETETTVTCVFLHTDGSTHTYTFEQPLTDGYEGWVAQGYRNPDAMPEGTYTAFFYDSEGNLIGSIAVTLTD